MRRPVVRGHAAGMTTPQQEARTRTEHPVLPTGGVERFVAWGVVGAPYGHGHYLGLRIITASTVGPAYRAVWHRDPSGAWTFHTTTRPEWSCPRYFGAQGRHEPTPSIDLDWETPYVLRVRMGERLDWRVELRRSVATRLMSAVGAVMPEAGWRSAGMLAAMGSVAGPMLDVGRVMLRGLTPNEQLFRAAPIRIWSVSGGSATLDGARLESVPREDPQPHLTDFWLPRRGIFTAGQLRFDPE